MAVDLSVNLYINCKTCQQRSPLFSDRRLCISVEMLYIYKLNVLSHLLRGEREHGVFALDM